MAFEPEAPDAVPRAGPTRVLRAQASPENLRESAHGLFVVGVIATVVGVLIVLPLIETWLEYGWTVRRTLVTLGMAAPLGYGLVCLARAVRMRRQAREIETSNAT